MMLRNKVVFVRDGQVYEQGFFGGGLADAVRGVPAAERAADDFTGRRKSGTFVAVGGLVCGVVALGFMGGHAAAEGDHSDAMLAEGIIAGACLIGSYIGLWRIASAEPYKYDAINLFNDASVAPTSGEKPSGWDVKP
jgi:hypothetical protein